MSFNSGSFSFGSDSSLISLPPIKDKNSQLKLSSFSPMHKSSFTPKLTSRSLSETRNLKTKINNNDNKTNPKESKFKQLILTDLDEWDKKNVQPEKLNKKLYSKTLSNKSTQLMARHSIGTFNFKNKLTNDHITLKSMKNIKKLNDFYKEIEQSKSNLLAKNIKINKSRFDFGAFGINTDDKIELTKEEKQQFSKVGNGLYILKNTTGEDEEEVASNRLTQLEKEEQLLLHDKTLHRNNLKLQGQYDKVLCNEHYAGIINDKNKMEKINWKEISELKKLMVQQTNLIEKYNQQLKNLITNYQKEKENYQSIADVYHYAKTQSNSKLTEVKFDDSYLKQVRIIKENLAKGNQEVELAKEKFIESENEYIIKTPFIEQKLRESKVYLEHIKNVYDKLTEESKEYYFHLLKEGIDVRDTGLSWIVFKLLELGATITINDFPKFIDQQSYKYLMEYSKKKLTLSKLKVMSRLITDTFIKKDHETEEEKKRKHLLHHKVNYKTISKKELQQLLNGIDKSLKDETVVITNENDLADKNNSSKAIRQIKGLENKEERINFFGNSKEKLENILNEDNSTNKKEVLDMISLIREKIKEIQQELITMKKDYSTITKGKFETLKQKGISEYVKYDLKYSALFGNHAII